MSYTGTGSVMAFPFSLYEHIDLFHWFTNQLRREHLLYQLPYTTPTRPWPCPCCTRQYESLQIRISLDSARRSHRCIVRFPTSYFLAFRDQGGLHAHSDIDRDRYSSSSSAKRPRGKASAPSLLAREASDCPLSLLFADSGFDRRRVDRLVQSERLCWARDLDPPTREAANGQQQQPGLLLVVLLLVRVGICRRMAIRLVSGQTEAAALSVSTTRSGIDQ